MNSKNFVIISSTFFYSGYFPKAPGSFASILGGLFWILLQDHIALYVILFLIITAIGFLFSGHMEAIEGKKDPSCVVIDEVSGIMISFFMLPISWPVILTAFFLFRAFDMFKIYPVNKFEKFEGSIGIMTDDIFAGLYTNIVMHIAIRLAGIV